ncbi:helix-turn-helix domain-containing protein, partial [Actinomyces viscosus]|uniref:helix-turn-helix domain-containing protein n=1 Tax=Actinomyces viscosus TaxID=1656 RepID=UPI0036F2C8BD
MGNSISPSRRQQVIDFDSRTSGMSVEEFCAQVGVSRASFYRIRRRAEHEGLTAALTAGSRAPHRPARVWGPDTDERIAQVRADLIAAGREAGPASVWWVKGSGRQRPGSLTLDDRPQPASLSICLCMWCGLQVGVD